MFGTWSGQNTCWSSQGPATPVVFSTVSSSFWRSFQVPVTPLTFPTGSTNPDKALKTLQPLVAEAGGESKLEVWPLDLTKQQSVRDFCQRFLDSGLPLHVLLCNGQLGLPPPLATPGGAGLWKEMGHCARPLLPAQ